MFSPVLAKHSKSFNLIDTLSVGVDRNLREARLDNFRAWSETVGAAPTIRGAALSFQTLQMWTGIQDYSPFGRTNSRSALLVAAINSLISAPE